MNLINDLFLLMFNLSQLGDKNRIVQLFIQSISEIFKPAIFNYSEQKKDDEIFEEEVITRNSSYGYIYSDNHLTDENSRHLQNAIQMLAVVLERLSYENTLHQEKEKIESIADERLKDIENYVQDLEQAKLASLNLVEDLTDEIELKEKTQKELLESEEKYRVLVESVAQPIFIVNRDGMFEFMNNCGAGMLGSAPEELTGSTMGDVFPKSIADGQMEKIRGALDFGKLVTSTSKSVMQGKEMWFTAQIQPLQDDNGYFNRALVILTDITECKQTEVALQESEERFKTLMHQSPMVMEIYDINGLQIEVNRAYEELWQFPASQTVKKFNILKSQEVIDTGLIDYVNRAYAGESVTVPEYNFNPTGDTEAQGKGRIRWLITTIYPLKDLNRKVKDIVITHSDITKLKHSEEAFREGEERFRSLIDSTSDGIIISDHFGKVTMWNNGAKNIFGYHADEIIGKPITYLMPRRFRDSHREGLLRFAKSDNSQHMVKALELEGLRKDRSVFPLELSLSTWHNRGIRLFATIIRDITERKQAEEEKTRLEKQLRRAQKLETIGTLAGGIVHDFNNILVPIMGYADMALRKLKKTDPLNTNLKHILNGAHRAKDLVEQILLFTKQSEKKRQLVSLQTMVKETLKLLRPSIPTTIEIRHRLDTLCEKVWADSTQINQVIVNLCTNAWQAMEEKGGKLTIKLTQKKVDTITADLYPNLNEADYACLSIIDTGQGMDEQTVDRIFEPFFTTKALDKGTGLGLSVVHGIIRSHKGDIFVYSEPGKGTAFHVYLPIIKSKKKVIEATSEKIIGGKEYVMIVDDEAAIAKMIKRMLESFGYKTDVYKTGYDAIKAFKQQPDKYDLLVSDLTMPQMTGLDLADELHKDRPEFPVMIMTGFQGSITAPTQEKYNIKQIIEKPIAVNELMTAVRKVWDK